MGATYFCRYCWREVRPEDRICPACGRSLTERLPYREALEHALRSPEALTARRAAYLLGLLEDPAAVSALRKTLDGEDPYVAAEAIRALARMGTAGARAAIRAAAGHRFATVRAAVRNALARPPSGIQSVAPWRRKTSGRSRGGRGG